MGTRSKQGYNNRCTVRGPVARTDLAEASAIYYYPDGHNRRERRRAVSMLARHIRRGGEMPEPPVAAAPATLARRLYQRLFR